MRRFLFLLIVSPLAYGSVQAQLPRPKDSIPGKKDTLMVYTAKHNTDSTKKENKKPKPDPIKPYKEVITDSAISQNGLFKVHLVDDKWYFEIPKKLFGKDILIVNRFVKVPGGYKTYGGEIINQNMIRFEAGPNKNIFIRNITDITQADSSNEIYKAVSNSNVNPLVQAFPIAAFGKDSATVVIDVTDFFKGDNTLTGVSGYRKKAFGITGLAPDRSYIENIKSYPINIDVRTVKTFNGTSGGGIMGGSPEAKVLTMELNSSFLLLPEKPMSRRLFDNRVGYFADDFTVYGDDQQKVDDKTFIVRWRLEPKDEDRVRWLKGELVEPKKPIIYYIDPATPKQWRPYLIAGINDWQKAFEAAGFKNAIIGKEWPENDTTMSLEDARFSVIRYFASDVLNAYGPNVHDPRSGEILESHIGWYHNVMKLLHDWYQIQAGPLDPKADKVKFDDELMGQLIRFVSSHEVGHTLGLRHNMGSSSKTPVELLRNKKWVEEHGHTASIMDYARFNYVAQPEDHISEKGLFPRINDYDKWAIKWGYSGTTAKTDEEDQKITNKWAIEAMKNPRLWFGGEGRGADPRAQTEDLGDDNMKASEYGILNLKRVLKALPEWTKEEANQYTNLADMYNQLITQFGRYMFHVARNIGGIETTYKSIEQSGPVYTATPKEKQQRAVAFLSAQLFDTPEWLLDKNVLNKIADPLRTDAVSQLQSSVLNNLLSNTKLNQIASNVNRFGKDTTYLLTDYFQDLHKTIWNLSANITDNYRRNLQLKYVQLLKDLIRPGVSSTTVASGNSIIMIQSSSNTDADIKAAANAELKRVKAELTTAKSNSSDDLTKDHYDYLLDDINVFFENK